MNYYSARLLWAMLSYGFLAVGAITLALLVTRYPTHPFAIMAATIAVIVAGVLRFFLETPKRPR